MIYLYLLLLSINYTFSSFYDTSSSLTSLSSESSSTIELKEDKSVLKAKEYFQIPDDQPIFCDYCNAPLTENIFINTTLALKTHELCYYKVTDLDVPLEPRQQNQLLPTLHAGFSCDICSKETEQVFVIFTCGHQVCFTCSLSIFLREQPCPFCRTPITMNYEKAEQFLPFHQIINDPNQTILIWMALVAYQFELENNNEFYLFLRGYLDSLQATTSFPPELQVFHQQALSLQTKWLTIFTYPEIQQAIIRDPKKLSLPLAINFEDETQVILLEDLRDIGHYIHYSFFSLIVTLCPEQEKSASDCFFGEAISITDKKNLVTLGSFMIHQYLSVDASTRDGTEEEIAKVLLQNHPIYHNLCPAISQFFTSLQSKPFEFMFH